MKKTRGLVCVIPWIGALPALICLASFPAFSGFMLDHCAVLAGATGVDRCYCRNEAGEAFHGTAVLYAKKDEVKSGKKFRPVGLKPKSLKPPAAKPNKKDKLMPIITPPLKLL